MIRFCDKEVWTIQEGQWTRLQMLSFFVRGHVTDIIKLVDENKRHIGVVTYRKLLYNHDTIPVCKESFLIEENFWQRASLVRKNLKSGDWSGVQEMIPPINEDICRKHLQMV